MIMSMVRLIIDRSETVLKQDTYDAEEGRRREMRNRRGVRGRGVSIIRLNSASCLPAYINLMF